MDDRPCLSGFHTVGVDQRRRIDDGLRFGTHSRVRAGHIIRMNNSLRLGVSPGWVGDPGRVGNRFGVGGSPGWVSDPSWAGNRFGVGSGSAWMRCRVCGRRRPGE